MASDDKIQVLHGDCLEVMAGMTDASVDVVVTDPPYGLAFMGKEWDHGVPGEPFWREALRVAKPGAHLVAFGGTRTFHRLACAIEDAGWEIRDSIMLMAWVYGTGFPKSLDVSKAIDKAATATEAARQWDGWGTALKPAWEPIILARKPLAGTVAANVLAHGTGGLNVDGCRVGSDLMRKTKSTGVFKSHNVAMAAPNYERVEAGVAEGRWPPNLAIAHHPECDPDGDCHPDCHARVLAEQSGESSTGTAARFFPQFYYCAKASRSERERGCEHLIGRTGAEAVDQEKWRPGTTHPRAGTSGSAARVKNHHPTVKPVALMAWLVRLVTPPGGLVLDPFAGSGTTGVAALQEGMRAILIELEQEYVEIIRARCGLSQPAPVPKPEPVWL